MSELLDKQFRFADMTMLLFYYIKMSGYRFKYGDAKRDKRCPYGNDNSLHHDSLAIDLLLFRPTYENPYEKEPKWEYMTKTFEYAEIGRFWKSIGGTWGGDWGDGNHFSLEHGGRK